MNTEKRTVLDAVRIVETREVGHESYEVCATAQAAYDESLMKMRIVLDAFVRHFEMRGRDEIFRPSWLPRSDIVETQISLDEALDAAKEIFGSWAQRVRNATPSPSQWSPRTPWLSPSNQQEVRGENSRGQSTRQFHAPSQPEYDAK